MTEPATPLPNLIAALGEAAAEIMEAAAHGDGAARWTARPEAIRTLAYGVPALLAAWNRRVPPPGQAALVDALREIARKDVHPYIQIGNDPNECGPTVMLDGSYAKIARAALSASPDDGRADAAGVG